jgi:hypothetical protein
LEELGDMEFDGPGLGVGILVDDPCETGGKVTGGPTDGRPYPALVAAFCTWLTRGPCAYGDAYAGLSSGPLLPKNAFT